MRRLLEIFVLLLEDRLPVRRSFTPYVVTPRQGRHTVRRRLLRSLRRRMAAPSHPDRLAQAGT